MMSYQGVSLGCADAAAGPFVLALKRFGASLKEFPNLAKYSNSLQVRSKVSPDTD